MLEFFKKKIPVSDAQEIKVVRSWTVRWETQGSTFQSLIVNHLVFVTKEETDEFIDQLNECAKFLNVWVKTKIIENI